MARSPARPAPAVVAAFVTVGIVTATRLWLASILGLAPDEAYYWQWSNDLALSYPDHPPLAAWMIRLGTSLLRDSALGVRLVFVLSGAAAAWLVYLTSRELGSGERTAALAALLATLLPAPATAALIATPDTPLGLCWLVGTLALVRLARGRSSANWYLLGAALGVGLLAKHSALLLLPVVVLASLLAPRLREGLRRVHPWLAALLALLVASPHLIAEVRAGLPAVSLQLAHLSGDLPATANSDGLVIPIRLLVLNAGQIGLLTPLVAFFAAVLCARLTRLDPAWRIAAVGLLLPVLVTAVSAVFVHPEQNWASLGHPLAACLAAGAVTGAGRSSPPRHPRAWLVATLLSVAACTAMIHVHALSPFLPLPVQRDPVSRLHGWTGLSEIDERRLGPVGAVVCDNYGLAAEFAWHAPEPYRSLPIVGLDRGAAPAPGRWLLLDEREDWSGAALDDLCDERESHGLLMLDRKDGRRVRTIDVWVGSGCHGAESAPDGGR